MGMPDFPCCLKVLLDAMRGVFAVIPMAVWGFAKVEGRGFPASFSRAGFGSSRSI
jgi:hypothetical protein